MSIYRENRGYGLWAMGFWPIFIPGGGENLSSWKFIVKIVGSGQSAVFFVRFSFPGAASLAMSIYRRETVQVNGIIPERNFLRVRKDVVDR